MQNYWQPKHLNFAPEWLYCRKTAIRAKAAFARTGIEILAGEDGLTAVATDPVARPS